MSTTGTKVFREIAAAKRPYLFFADQVRAVAGGQGYINNSLEGTECDADDTGTGQLVKSFGTFFPNWHFYDFSGGASTGISAVSIANGVCTVIATGTIAAYSGTLSAGDIISINGVTWDTTHPFINGAWVIKSLTTTSVLNDTITFEIDFFDTIANYTGLLGGSFIIAGPTFEIRDNRATSDAKGMSCTSLLFTPMECYRVSTLSPTYKRVLPSDLYTRFKFQTGSAAVPQGGINSNLFSSELADTSGNPVKPILWAYFFGYNSEVVPGNIFEIVFNSYAVVLRPSGSGSNLEFAIVKFSWGTDPGTATNLTSLTPQFAKYTVPNTAQGTDLGYLISTNPSIGTDKVTELAVSDSFTYDSEFPAKFNLKITIRKHLLSDSVLDGTYLVNLMISDNYEAFGPGKHYDTVLHAYITKPTPLYSVVTGSYPHDAMLMPMVYFKFVNIDANYVNAESPFANPPYPGSSKIIQDNLFYRQINSAALNTAGKSYLY